MNNCVDCGAPTSGLRCRQCNVRHMRLNAALELEAADRAILEEGISGDRLGERMGVSKQRGYTRIRQAKRRLAFLDRQREAVTR